MHQAESGGGRNARAVEALEARFGERLSRNGDVRAAHGRGEGFHADMPPDAVVFLTSTAEVAEAVQICAGHGAPVIPFGAGTSLEGGVAAVAGGVCLDLSGLDRVLAVNAEDLDCVVQAGVTREALDASLRDVGLFFPVDPGANATLGGMAATRASGTTTVRYGAMRDNVLSLKVVLADGSVVETATRARKSAAGYDLTRLFIGSEGTLGVITELTLRLHGRPEAQAAAVCSFPSLAAAVDSVIETMQVGAPVARIELLDAVQVRACNRLSDVGLPEQPALFFEFHGTDAGVREAAERVAEITAGHGGGGFRWATRTEERNALWRARHQAYHAAKALRPGSALLVSDVCVPISRLADCILATHEDIAAAGALAPIVGHVGDGNFHVMFSVDPEAPEDVARARDLNSRLIDRALAMGGTCTGEHGVGLGKRAKLVAELGPEVVGVMARIKAALDPAGLLNPGKIFLPG